MLQGCPGALKRISIHSEGRAKDSCVLEAHGVTRLSRVLGRSTAFHSLPRRSTSRAAGGPNFCVSFGNRPDCRSPREPWRRQPSPAPGTDHVRSSGELPASLAMRRDVAGGGSAAGRGIGTRRRWHVIRPFAGWARCFLSPRPDSTPAPARRQTVRVDGVDVARRLKGILKSRMPSGRRPESGARQEQARVAASRRTFSLGDPSVSPGWCNAPTGVRARSSHRRHRP